MNSYEIVKQQLNDNVQLCVVTKKHSVKQIMHFYNLGERIFAESRAQELLEKVLLLPEDIQWQFIGHLQRNKVKDIVPHVSRIQSLDSIRLAQEIEKQCAKQNKIMPCLVEFHLAEQDTNKSGLSYEEAIPFFKQCQQYKHLKLEGIMVMGPHTEEKEEIKKVFLQAHELFCSLQNEFGKEQIRILSMGMSEDYEIAVACGSNMVRIGTFLFQEL